MSESENDRCSTPEKTKRKRGESSKTYFHKKQNFSPEWLTIIEFSNWLLPEHNNKLSVKCKLCVSEMTAELSVIKKHAKTKKHISSVNSIGTRQNSMISFINNDQLKLVEQTKMAEILLCSFISEHNLPFNISDYLVKTCKAAFPDSKVCSNISLARTKSTALVSNVIGLYFLEELTKVLKKTLFSLIIEESTDVGCVKTMCICVKYFDSSSNTFETKFFKLVQLFEDIRSADKGATGQKIFDEVYKLSQIRKFRWII